MGNKVAAAPFAKDGVVEALEAFAGHPHYLVQQGTHHRAASEVVQKWPEKFIRLGASDSEKHAARLVIHPPREPQQHVPLATTTQPLADENAVLAIHSLHGAPDGDTHLAHSLMVAAGTRLRADHPLVRANRSAFVPVVPPGRTRGEQRHRQERLDGDPQR